MGELEVGQSDFLGPGFNRGLKFDQNIVAVRRHGVGDAPRRSRSLGGNGAVSSRILYELRIGESRFRCEEWDTAILGGNPCNKKAI